MKKFLLFIPAAALAFTIASCKKEAGPNDIQTVSSVYKALMFEYTATWCGPCGQYGYPAMHHLIGKYCDTLHQATCVTMHPSDDIVNNEPDGMADIIDFFGFTGTPSAAVNAGPDTYPTYLEPKVTQALTANPTAKAGVGVNFTVSGSSVTVNTKSVFFTDVTGTYNLAVYVVEDDIMEQQNGQTPAQVEHRYTLRAIADAKAFGTAIATNPAKGTKVDGSYTIAIPEIRDAGNVHIVCAIWKMDPATGEPTDLLNSNLY